MDTSKEQVQTLFNTFCTDGSGTITFEAALTVAKELGLDVNTVQDIKNAIPSCKTNYLSFDIFYLWFNSKQHNLETFADPQIKFSETMKKGKQILDELSDIIQHQCNGLHESHSIQLNIGQAEPSTKIALQFLSGQPQRELIEKLLNGQNEINENQPTLIFTLKCQNPQAARNTLEQIVTDLLAFGKETIPDSEQQLDLLKFFFTTPDNETLNFGITLQYNVLEPILKQYIEIANLVFGQQNSAIFSKMNLEVATTFDFKQLIADPEKTVKEIFIEKNLGLNLRFLIDASEVFMKNIKDVFVKHLEDHMKNLQEKQQAKIVNSFSSFLLLKETKFHFNFKLLSDLGEDKIQGTFLDEFFDQIPFSNQKLNDIKQEYPVSNDMMQGIPFLEDLVNFAKEQLVCDFNVAFSIPKCSLVLNVKSQGVQELFDYLLTN